MKSMKKNSTRIDPLSEEEIDNSTVVAVMNNKGGCAKTTTSIAFGLQMARLGYRVLFVDSDPQSNMSQRLGMDDSMYREKRISNLFQKSDIEQSKKERLSLPLTIDYPYFSRAKGSSEKPGILALLPGSRNAEIEAKASKDRFVNSEAIPHPELTPFFKNSIDVFREYFDYIVIDTAPAMEGNVLNVITTGVVDEIVCPVDGLEAALGIPALYRWVYGKTIENSITPNMTFAMVKYHTDSYDLGYEEEAFMDDEYVRNSVYQCIKETFGDFMCKSGVREQRSLRNAVQGFIKSPYQALSNELHDRFTSGVRENIFEVTDPSILHEFSENLNIIEKKALVKKPTFKEPFFVL